MNQKMLLLLLSLSAAVFSQQDTVAVIEKPDSATATLVVPGATSRDAEYTTQQLQTKLAGYTRMHNAGHTLLATGIPLTCMGVLGLFAGFAILTNNEPSGLVPIYIGELGIAFGPELLVAGAVLNTVGGNKQREYEGRLHVGVGINSILFTFLF
jgi:hypothetical protein